MADKKLRIPGPNEREDLTQLDNTIFYGLMLCLLAAGLLAVYTKHQASRAEIREAAAAPEPPKSGLEARQRELVVQHEGAFDEHAWTGEDAIAVIRYGPRPAAEAACRQAFERGELPRTTRVELLAVANRQAEHAPWVCLLRAFIEGKTENMGQLHDELETIWERAERFRASPGILSLVVESFAESGVPDNPRYRNWLYVCAFQPSTPGEDCRASLRAISDEPTLLGTLDDMALRHEIRLPREKSLARSVDGLAALAKNGEMEGWPRSEAVSRRQVQLGAVFWMCRLAHSPTAPLARAAIDGLADVANVVVRAGDKNLRPRWRETCQAAFRTGGTDDDPASSVVTAWTAAEGNDPRPSLRTAVDNGICELPSEDSPLWLCGADAWRGSGEDDLQTELTDFYTETRWIEWEE